MTEAEWERMLPLDYVRLLERTRQVDAFIYVLKALVKADRQGRRAANVVRVDIERSAMRLLVTPVEVDLEEIDHLAEKWSQIHAEALRLIAAEAAQC